MKFLSFAGRQREGRSGEPGLPSILLPAAVETKPRNILIGTALPPPGNTPWSVPVPVVASGCWCTHKTAKKGSASMSLSLGVSPVRVMTHTASREPSRAVPLPLVGSRARLPWLIPNPLDLPIMLSAPGCTLSRRRAPHGGAALFFLLAAGPPALFGRVCLGWPRC